MRARKKLQGHALRKPFNIALWTASIGANCDVIGTAAAERRANGVSTGGQDYIRLSIAFEGRAKQANELLRNFDSISELFEAIKTLIPIF